MVYRDRKTRMCYAKRFQVSSYIMNKEYPLVPKGCKVEKIFDRYGVVLECQFKHGSGRKKSMELKFDDIEIRRHTARGFKIDNKLIDKFIQLKRGTDPNTGVGDDD